MIVGRLYGSNLIPTGVLSANNAMTNSDIYSVVTLISSDIAGMKFTGGGSAQDALERPSKHTARYNFYQSIVAKLLLYGNAYAIIQKDGDVVTGFEQLQDDQVTQILISDDGQDVTYEVHFEDNRPDTWYDSSEMLHFKLISVGSDRNSMYFGKSPLVSLATDIALSDLTNQLAKSTLENGINPSVMIEVPEAQLDKEVKNSIRDGFVESTSGANFGKPIVIDSSAKVSTLGIQPEVTTLLTNLSFTKTQISKAFGVPDSMLLGSGDAQSSIDMIRGMYTSSLSRYKNAIQSELSLKLGLPIEMAEEIQDDALITRLVTLTDKQIISPADANAVLKQKGVI